jgi:hypothetical protein
MQLPRFVQYVGCRALVLMMTAETLKRNWEDTFILHDEMNDMLVDSWKQWPRMYILHLGNHRHLGYSRNRAFHMSAYLLNRVETCSSTQYTRPHCVLYRIVIMDICIGLNAPCIAHNLYNVYNTHIF